MRGPLSYVGGKNRIAARIAGLIPEHRAYVEPFSGGAQVFFQKEPSKVEVLNDLDGELVTFFRVCQSHHEELIRYTHFFLGSREWFTRLRDAAPSDLTDVQRAARYLYLQKVVFGGRVRSQSYAYSVASSGRFKPDKLAELIEKTHQRLVRTQIEHSPYQEVLKRYDRPTTFFYIDPPYYGIKLYRHNLEKRDFVELRDHLRALSGKFLLSINDVPDIRVLFAEFHIETIDITYTVQTHGERRHQELLIRNYTLNREGEDGPRTQDSRASPAAVDSLPA